ncbi:MAG: lysophospholipid acyltransferase family protein [Planctomycetaceae bacterium]
MNPTLAAQMTLAVYAAVAVAVIGWQMFRCPTGPVVWFLFVVERLYIGLMFRWSANGRCPVPQSGPALIIANHLSPTDPLMLWMNHHLMRGGNGHPRAFGFMIAQEYARMPGVAWLCRISGAIPVARSGRDMGPAKAALERLREGRAIGVFPEGRLGQGDELLPGNPGIAWLALRAGVPIYPVFIHDQPCSDSMVAPFLKPRKVRVSYGEPILLDDYAEHRKTQDTLREVTTLLMTRLAELGGVEYDPSQRPRQRFAVVPESEAG